MQYPKFLKNPRDEIIHINKMFFAKKNKEQFSLKNNIIHMKRLKIRDS